MSTIISEIIEETLAEAGYAHPEVEAEARRIIERNTRQGRLDRFDRQSTAHAPQTDKAANQ
jgi:hypothetical protein